MSARRVGPVLVLALGLAGPPARAALEPCYTDEYIASATMVFQVVDPDIGPIDAYSNCTLTGEIARAFRGPHPVGTRIQTTFACAWNGTIGPGVWFDRNGAIAAPVIEVHIRPGGGASALLYLPDLTEGPVWRGEDCRGRPLGG